LRGVACEKPLARNVAEAKRLVQLAQQSHLLTGYLENQVFAPAVVKVFQRIFLSSLNKKKQ
jgi:predicted dehydrogenase